MTGAIAPRERATGADRGTARHVIVIGGGITGLSHAWTLREEARTAGIEIDVTVLEAGIPGGHAQTIREDGFLVEAGPNGFLDREPETMALVRELGIESQLIQARPEARRRFIVRGGRLCLVPDSPHSLIGSPALSLGGKLRLIGELFAAGPPAGVDETVYDFARRRVGREAAEMLVDAAVSGISAGDSRALSVASQFPTMVEMEREHGSLIRAMFARRKHGRKPARLVSFTGGMSTIVNALIDRLGVSIRPHASVATIHRHGGAWCVLTREGDVFDADHVVLAVSARAAAPMLGDVDEGLARALREIPFSSLSVVALAFGHRDLQRPLDGYGYLTTRPEQMATLGVVWESSLFAGRAPDGAVLLRVMLGGSRRPEVAVLENSDVIDIAREELKRVMKITAAPSHVWTFRWPSAIAQYTVGHARRLADIRARLARHTNLELCGTSFDGVSFNQAIASGRKLAREIVGRGFGPTVSAEREGPAYEEMTK